MEGYIQALIDSHYMRLERLTDKQFTLKSYEETFIEELENLKKYVSSENKENK